MLQGRNFMEFLLILTLCQKTSGSHDEIFYNILNNQTSKLIECISLVSDMHRKSFENTIVIFENTFIPEDIMRDLTKKLLDNAFIHINNIQDLHQLNQVNGTILVISYYNTWEELLYFNLTVFNLKLKNLIIIDNVVDDGYIKILEEMLLPIRGYDVTFLVKDHMADVYKLQTFIPEIDESTCNITELTKIVTINKCFKGSLEKFDITNVFPLKKPVNLKKCVFNVGMATLFPYSMLDQKELYKNLDPVDDKCYGADVELMKIIANKFNATMKLYYVFRDEETPYLHLELMYYLLNATLDACAGGLYRVYGDVVAYSGIYNEQAVIWVYTVAREVKSWQSLASKISGLYIFFIFYICYAILWKLMSNYDNDIVSVGDALVFSWGALVGASGLRDARSLKLKILNIFYLTMCIHLSSYINTQIYYYLTIQQPPHTFDTFEELAVSDRTPYLRYSAKYFIDDKKYNALVNTSRDCENFSDCEDKMLKNWGSTIIIDEKLPHLQSTTAVNDEARVLKVPQDILFVYHEMVMRKDHFLVSKFAAVTERLFETGIYNKLLVNAIGITVVDKAKIANQNILSNSYSCLLGCPITLRESAGAFYIWMIGCVLSCIIFVLEINFSARESFSFQE